METRIDDKIGMNMFIATMTLSFGIMGYLFFQINVVQGNVSTSIASQNSINVQLAQIQTDVSWIKSKIAQ